MNIYTPNHTVLKYINQQLTEENYINQIFRFKLHFPEPTEKADKRKK